MIVENSDECAKDSTDFLFAFMCRELLAIIKHHTCE